MSYTPCGNSRCANKGIAVDRVAFGQYRLLEELGKGGMGCVYKALHTIMDRVVAIKVIAPELVQNPVAVEWFRREVRACTQLTHPNIVMAYDANECDGFHFLVMEYVHGVTLDALVKQHGPLPIDHACALMRQAALGLQHAHEKGMVHRDIKPGNLLIPKSENDQPADVLVKIVDFGLARLQGKARGDTIALRAEADVLGTPDYISPEQSRDIHAADIRSDLYSLGCTFYFALAGRAPFAGETAMEKLVKHLMDEAEPLENVRPNVPPGVAGIVRKLMAKDPAERPQTPAELVRLLDDWPLEHPEAIPSPPTACRPLWIAPPTHGPGPRAEATEDAAYTRPLARIEPFVPSDADVPADPSLLEPVFPSVHGEATLARSRETKSLSQAEDTEASTAVATAFSPAEQHQGAACGEPSETTLPDGQGTAAAPNMGLILRRCWRRWAVLIETIVRGRGAGRVNGNEYRLAYTELLHVCRAAIEAAADAEQRGFYQELMSIVQPWLSLQTFAHTDVNMLEALRERCQQAELELNDGKIPWTLRQCVGLVLLLLSPIGLTLWYFNSGRVWLPALTRSFEWGSSTPSLRSAWSYVEKHPSLLMGVAFPVVIAFSIYLLARTPRT